MVVALFVEAHYRVCGDRSRARCFLNPQPWQLREGCTGSIRELFDGDALHGPRGCFDQAGSLRELLRASFALADSP